MTLEAGPSEGDELSPEAIASALAAFGRRLEGDPEPVLESVLNDNYHVATDAGPAFLRFVRKDRSAERVLFEHRLVAHAAAAGIPVVEPALSHGRPFVRSGGRMVQLYPWMEGRHGHRTAVDAHAIGEMQARVHLALRDFRDAELPHGGSGATWDTEAAIQLLSRVDDLIRYYPSPPLESLRIQEGLRLRLEILESAEPRPVADFSALPVQPCHGDYHSRNILLDDAGEVVAVLDWELASVIPPVFELVRALSFCNYLDSPALEAYVRSYASHRRISHEECELGVEMWWQSRLHDTWLYRRQFIRGDRRADRFMDVEDILLRRFRDAAYRRSLAARLRELAGP